LRRFESVSGYNGIMVMLVLSKLKMNTGLTLEQRATNDDTWHHINKVQKYVNNAVVQLIRRAQDHDQSKLVSPEVEYFSEVDGQLQGLTYNSPEYKANLERLKPALDHHYANNRHHPQHFKNGVDDMNLLDLLEMICDWKASSERHGNGNIRKSIEVNAERFGMSPQLRKIFENTVDVILKD
jgi:hypothetical protein